MQTRLRITRYQKTRYWAIWNEGELLSVTVYRKGAQAVLNYINNIINTPTTHNKTMAKTKSNDTSANDTTILKAVNGEGKTIRIKFDPLGVSVCYNLKGKWIAHEIYNQPLPELVAEGVFTIEDEDSQNAYNKYFGKKDKRSKAKRKSKKQNQKVKQVEPEEQQSEAIEETPQSEEMVAAEINEEVEAALWQEIEEAREQERFMEVQDTDEALDVLNDESTLNEPVTDVEPPAEAPAQESDAQPAEAKTTDIVEIKLATYNVKKAGQAPMAINADNKNIQLEPGDQLLRIYKGILIEVNVQADGYEWQGTVYPTLTHISWKAAGYQIGGNAFFGLPSKPRKKA